MNGDKNILEKLLCCPSCRQDLFKKGNKLVCLGCRENYSVREKISILINRFSSQNLKQVDYFSRAKNVTTAPYFLEEWHKSFLRRWQENFPALKGKVILDGGVGQGYATIELAREGARIIACDLSFPALLRLKKIAIQEGVEERILFVCCSLENLPIKERVADGVLANAVLEHLDCEEEALKEIDRVAKRQSTLMVSAPLKYRCLFPLFIPSSIWQDKMIGHLRRYDEKTLCLRFKKFNFKMIKSYYSGHFKKVIFTKIFLPIFGSRRMIERLEDADRREERQKLWASNICLIFRRQK